MSERGRRPVRIVHRDALYVPEEAVDGRALRELLEVPFQTKEHCHPTCQFARAPNRFCSTCPGREARIRMWRRVTTPGGLRLVAMAGGDRRVLDRVVRGAYEIVDRRCDARYRTPLRWQGNLRDGRVVDGKPTANQVGMLKQIRASIAGGQSGGILIAPPRTGKCVLPHTLVRTSRGYHQIRSLFAHRSPAQDVEEIGRFGLIAAPGGAREVRGLTSRTSDRVVLVELDMGTVLGGTPEHPIRVIEDDGTERWCRLDQLRGDEHILTARETTDPVPPDQGLTEEQAQLVGGVVRVADFERLCAGVLHLSAGVLAHRPDLPLLLRGICRLVVTRDVMVEFRTLPVLDEWVELLMASTREAWRTFAMSAAWDDGGTVGWRLPDADVARALHMHLIGAGVMSCLHPPLSDSHVVEVVDHEAWRDYVDHGAIDPDLDVSRGHLCTRITSIKTIMLPHRVMDLSVPDGHAFYTDGIVSHNTVIGVASSVAERARTFVTASKIDFLRQFGRRFGELTNLRDLHARGLTPVVLVDPNGWPDGPSYGVTVYKKWCPEVERADVVMSCFQQFLDTTNGRRRLEQYLLGRFGMVVTDEIQDAAARMFLRLVHRLDCRRKVGLTATVQRKDGTHPVLFKTIGPVVAKSSVVSDLPTIELEETGVGVSRDYKDWNAMTTFLVNLEERNLLILRRAFADLRANPLNTVLITTTRRSHVAQLVKMINAQAAYCVQEKGERWPRELALAYQGGSDTNALLNLAMTGRCRVVVGMVRMVMRGLDVARWTHVYAGIVPTSNPYDVYQLINRVCTPYPTKPKDRELMRLRPDAVKPGSTARIFLDALSASVYCLAKLYKDKDFGFRAGTTRANYIGVPLYRIPPKTLARLDAIARSPKDYDPADAGVEVTLGRTKTGKRRRKQAWKARAHGITRL